jgi:hypothetical protein
MSWGISGMCGEIAGPIDEQLAGLRSLGVARANLTSLSFSDDEKPRSIDTLTDDELVELDRRLNTNGITGYCVTSPVAKYAVDTDPDLVARQLDRSIQAANILDSRYLRIFSFAPRGNGTAETDRDQIHQAFENLVTTIEDQGNGVIPLLENNYRMYTADGPSIRDLLADYAPGRVALAFDAHACVVAGVKAFDDVWPEVEPWVQVLHLKDYVAETKTIVPVGHGDGQLSDIVAAADSSVVEDLALEPHLHNSEYGAGRDPLDLFRESRDAVLNMLDTTGQPRPPIGKT